MRRKTVLKASTSALLVFFSSFQIQGETKKISFVGQVVNGTLDNVPVANQEVELRIYMENQEITDAIQKTRTDDNGYFRFSQLDYEPGLFYSTLSIYKNVEYYGPILDNLDKKPVKDYQIVVYESTSVDPGILESMHHYIISYQSNILNINEIILLKNDSKKSFIGDFQVGEDRRRVISFSLPQNLTNLALGDGMMECCVVFANGTLTNTMALPPGIKQISFSYSIPFKSSEYLFQKILDYNVEIMNVFLTTPGVGIKSSVLENKGPFEVQDQIYYRHAVRNLKKREHLEFRLTNLPYSKKYTPFFFATGIILALAIALVYWRYRRGKEESGPLEEEREKLMGKKEKILKEIERITVDLNKKRISKEQYSQKYRQLKSELISLYKELR